MKKIVIILFVFIQLVCRAEYDSTYVLSITQKYAIPENVSNGDYVGIWKKTLTWQSVGAISFAIQQNFNNAFSINSSSGLITISDATKINGKVVQQDTTINLIIRTTDAGVRYEDDTCKIWIKENAYCVFVDYSQGTNGSGSRTSPEKDLDDITIETGKMYCIKRGNIILGEATLLRRLVSTKEHPLIICAYGAGNKPKFSTGPDYDSVCFDMWTNNGETHETNMRSEYIYFYDLCVRDYGCEAYLVRRKGDHMGWYNCETYNCDKTDGQSSFTLNTSLYADSTVAYDFEMINYYADTTSLFLYRTDLGSIDPCHNGGGCYDEPSFIKTGVGIDIINSYFGKSPGFAVRIGGGVASYLPGNTIKHCILNSTQIPSCGGNSYPIQIRCDNETVEDCRITTQSTFGLASMPMEPYSSTPENLTVKNCYFANQTRSAIILASNGVEWQPHHNTVIEDNDINSMLGVELVKEVNTTIRRNKIHGVTSGNGIKSATSSTGLSIYYNTIYGYATGVYLPIGSGATIYNNTIDGDINCTGAITETVRNNYFKSLTDAATYSNNLDMDTITPAKHFRNYASHNYRLKSTAFSAIDNGYTVSLSPDIAGTSVPQGSGPDIGAYEYAFGLEPTTTSELYLKIEGEGSVNLSSGTYRKDTVLIITATPDAGWVFERWEGDTIGTDRTIMIEMQKDKYLVAIFKYTVPMPENILARVNFTTDSNYDEAGWTNIYGSASLPANLGNGLKLSHDGTPMVGSTVGMAETMFPPNVGGTSLVFNVVTSAPIEFRISGLDPAYIYSFHFFSSRYDTDYAWGTSRRTSFSIGKDTVTVNSVGNKDKLLTIDDVVPTLGGEVSFFMHRYESYGYINAMVIEKQLGTSDHAVVKGNDAIDYYPVPVKDWLMLQNVPEGNTISMYDLAGRKVMEQKNRNSSNMQINMKSLKAGLYIIKIEDSSSPEVKNLKVIKN